MKNNIKCNFFGHKWIPVYIRGNYNEKDIKFISCYCKRCNKGYVDLMKIIDSAKNLKYGTYNEQHYK